MLHIYQEPIQMTPINEEDYVMTPPTGVTIVEVSNDNYSEEREETFMEMIFRMVGEIKTKALKVFYGKVYEVAVNILKEEE